MTALTPIDVQQECLGLLLYGGLRADTTMLAYLETADAVVKGYQGDPPVRLRKGGQLDYEKGKLPVLGVYPDERGEFGGALGAELLSGYKRNFYAMWAMTMTAATSDSGTDKVRSREERATAMAHIAVARMKEIVEDGATITTPWGDIPMDSYLTKAQPADYTFGLFPDPGIVAVEMRIEVEHPWPPYKVTDPAVEITLVRIIEQSDVDPGQELEVTLDIDPTP